MESRAYRILLTYYYWKDLKLIYYSIENSVEIFLIEGIEIKIVMGLQSLVGLSKVFQGQLVGTDAKKG